MGRKRGASRSRSAAKRGGAKRRGSAKRGGAKRRSTRSSAKRSRARRSTSPVARVKRVTQEVAQQAVTAVTAGVETLRDFGGNLVDRVRNEGGGSSGGMGGM